MKTLKLLVTRNATQKRGFESRAQRYEVLCKTSRRRLRGAVSVAPWG